MVINPMGVVSSKSPTIMRFVPPFAALWVSSTPFG
jgi:hypothetical protein